MLKLLTKMVRFLVFLFFVASAYPQGATPPQGEVPGRLAELAAGLQKAEQAAAAVHLQAMLALNKSYDEALDRAIATAIKKGKLDEVLKLRTEKKNIEDGKRVPPDDDNDTPASLKTLRDSYRKSAAKNADDREKLIKPSYLRYDKTLAEYETALTKQGRIEDAVLVKTAREDAAAKHAGGDLPKEEEAPVLKGDVKPTLAFDEKKKKGGVLKGVGFFFGDHHVPIDLTAANPFHDFVEVYVSGYDGWMARRANGDLVADCCLSGKWKPFNEHNVRSVTMGQDVVCLTRAGELKDLDHEGKKPPGDYISRRFFFPVAWAVSRAAFDRDGILVKWGSYWHNKLQPSPPKDFFKGAVAFTAGGLGPVGFFTDRPPVTWILAEGKGSAFTFPERFKGCIQGAAKDQALLIMRNLAGKVFVTSTQKVETDADFAPPASLPPAIRVRAGRDFCAAQAADGTWQAWGKPGEALKRIKEIGPALDLDGTESDLNRSCLMWIEPEK